MTVESLDVTTGELLTISYIQISWIDEFLVWNPTEYGGITKLSISYDKLWIPSLSLSNGALKENTGQVINPGFAPVKVLPTGFVLLVTSGYYLTKCDIDTRFYPFDEHVCSFIFFSALHDTTEMEINSHLSDFALGMFQENYIWYHTQTEYKKFTSSTEGTGFSLSSVQFIITLKRRPTFELINSYIPILLLTVLNITTNFVPANSGERLSFAITLYLSFIFITTAHVDEMPHVSVNIAFSSYVMLSLNALNTANVLWSVLMVRMSRWHTCKVQISGTLKILVDWYHKEKGRRKVKVHPNESDSVIEDLDQRSERKEPQEKGSASNAEIGDEIDSLTWLDVADVLDKVYSTIITVLVAGVILAMVCLWVLS
ncbi:acetylcholine receptor subunit beta-like [Mercenaria mercenaria]|uniref:acetylcholine receptor subunit beta-like n=1 Tax=Mercenaria mercenaria TaxID=6596 RepID=UPI00234E942C|nr:acetylcholine receptor subunit beta-like [Mercenaria mercenaria]